MAKRENESYSIKYLLEGMLKDNKLQKGIDEINVQEAWVIVMGKGIQSYTDSVILQNKSLIVKLNSSALREELSYGKEKIIKMMNEQLEKDLISKIRLL